MPQYDLYSDGSVKDKIGYFGFVLFRDHEEIDRGWGQVGCGVTSTEAEYCGVSAGLDSFIRHVSEPSSHLNCYTDCANVVRHLNKIARRNLSHDVSLLFWKLDQIRQYATVDIEWIARYKNVVADALAKTLRPRL